MNKQPFYHSMEGQMLFTLTEPITKKEFLAAVERGLMQHGYVKGSLEHFDPREVNNTDLGEQYDGWLAPEAGDPHDLM